MSPDLDWFVVRLALQVMPLQEGYRAMADLHDELLARPYYRDPQVMWDDKLNCVVVEVGAEGLAANSAADGMAEELVEISSAVLGEFERYSVEILGVRPVSS
jgi:hypothetical protein